jgi:hypothetical protein
MQRLTLVRRLVLLAVAVLLLGIRPAFAEEFAADRILHRELGVWFGTLTVDGAPGLSQDFLELTALVSDDLIGFIDADSAVDSRVTAALSPGGIWSNSQTGFEWVFDPKYVNPDPSQLPTELHPLPDLPAQQNLIDAYTAMALAQRPRLISRRSRDRPAPTRARPTP